ncbi:hypothetical protein F0562_019471 [Nyssa sinensis]|uniref:Uncharacterized protein n=1 Tax=Nyssa sinensis TaxID=561372 RepID=A0A5J5BSI0_9ASTE|nr:hypothetical protein F0562_019471 [Nyssa sinensis]
MKTLVKESNVQRVDAPVTFLLRSSSLSSSSFALPNLGFRLPQPLKMGNWKDSKNWFSRMKITRHRDGNFGKVGNEQLAQYRSELQAVACVRQELQKPQHIVREITQWLLLDLLTLWFLQMNMEKNLFY